jgi:hypothetical protein
VKIKAKDLKEGDRLAKSENKDHFIDLDAGEKGDGSFFHVALDMVHVSKRGVFVTGLDLVSDGVMLYSADYDPEDELEIERDEEANQVCETSS